MVDINGLNEFLEHLNNVSNNMDRVLNEALEETATEVVAEAKASTPVKTGNLRRSWTHGEVQDNSKGKYIEVGSSLSYAQAVEEGHRQQVGKYIPSIGKRLIKPYIQGRFMLRDAIKKNNDTLQKKVNEKLNSIK